MPPHWSAWENPREKMHDTLHFQLKAAPSRTAGAQICVCSWRVGKVSAAVVSWGRARFTACLSHSAARALLQMSHTSLPVARSLWQSGTREWASAACLYSRNSASRISLWHPSHPTAQPPLPSACPWEIMVQAGLWKSLLLGEWSPCKAFSPSSGQDNAFSPNYWWNNLGMWRSEDFYPHIFYTLHRHLVAIFL